MKEDNLKSKIVDECIKSLQTEGLRFSVDTLAKRLKVSKKTIYAYFSSKEELATAVYDSFYKKCRAEIDDAQQNDKWDKTYIFLKVYYKSFCMACDDIFNKYALNGAIKTSARQMHNELWQTIAENLKIEEDEAYKIIIHGTFSELRKKSAPYDEVIKRLAQYYAD